MYMEVVARRTLYDWIVEQIDKSGFEPERKKRKSPGSTSYENGNGELTVPKDIELVVNVEIRGVEPGYIFVPKGSLVKIYRHPTRVAPVEAIATIFVGNKYQASIRGDRRTIVKVY